MHIGLARFLRKACLKGAHILVKVLVSGACGRMGQAVVKAVLADAELSLVAAVDVHGGGDVGEIAGYGKCGVTVATDLAQALLEAKPDVMVDFTRPDVVFSNAMLSVKHGSRPSSARRA